jgi:hypothetical protein
LGNYSFPEFSKIVNLKEGSSTSTISASEFENSVLCMLIYLLYSLYICRCW